MNNNRSYNKKIGCLNYQELKEVINSITCSSGFAVCVDIEQAINSSNKISENQKVNLMSLLFMVSLSKGIYHEKDLLSLMDRLVLSAPSKATLSRIIKLLLESGNVMAKQVMSIMDSMFAAPSACQDSLISLADWIESCSVLCENERESLANLAKQRAVMLAMAFEGDKEIYQVLIHARSKWYLEAIGNAVSIEELSHLQVAIVNDRLTATSQAQLIFIIKQAEASVEKNGAVDIEECIVYILHKAISSCQLNSCGGGSLKYCDATNQIIQWVANSTGSPLMIRLLALAKHRITKCENGMLLENFKSKMLLFYGY
ncbi:MAG: hypothetical protein QS721_03235 [Candidatus Endonucleobacter sp. (ex Gigantidas childressi)]|nr:hypothetical protein [Candidatus Endonucleobacter sp. (ex Gigantidas childressi)]